MVFKVTSDVYDDPVWGLPNCVPDEWKKQDLCEELYSAARGCLSKRRFASKRKARISADKAEIRSGAKLGVYHCRHCGGWHMTSKRLAEQAALQVGA